MHASTAALVNGLLQMLTTVHNSTRWAPLEAHFDCFTITGSKVFKIDVLCLLKPLLWLVIFCYIIAYIFSTLALLMIEAQILKLLGQALLFCSKFVKATVVFYNSLLYHVFPVGLTLSWLC